MTETRRCRAAVIVCLCAALGLLGALRRAGAALTNPPPVQWVRQLGTAGFDGGQGVALDGHGNVYLTGFLGSGGVFAAKYDANGNQMWLTHAGGGAGQVQWHAATDAA